MITNEVLLIPFFLLNITFEFHFTLDNRELTGIISRKEKMLTSFVPAHLSF